MHSHATLFPLKPGHRGSSRTLYPHCDPVATAAAAGLTWGRLKAMVPMATLGWVFRVKTYLWVTLRTVTCLRGDGRVSPDTSA